MLLFTTYFVRYLINTLFEERFDSILWLAILYCIITVSGYGESDYSSLRVSGPYKVGIRRFKSHTEQNQCYVYFPACDDSSGTMGHPLNLAPPSLIEKTYTAFSKMWLGYGIIPKMFLQRVLGLCEIPVRTNAKIALDRL